MWSVIGPGPNWALIGQFCMAETINFWVLGPCLNDFSQKFPTWSVLYELFSKFSEVKLGLKCPKTANLLSDKCLSINAEYKCLKIFVMRDQMTIKGQSTCFWFHFCLLNMWYVALTPQVMCPIFLPKIPSRSRISRLFPAHTVHFPLNMVTNL